MSTSTSRGHLYPSSYVHWALFFTDKKDIEKLLIFKSELVLTELFNIAVNGFGAMKCAHCNEELVIIINLSQTGPSVMYCSIINN